MSKTYRLVPPRSSARKVLDSRDYLLLQICLLVVEAYPLSVPSGTPVTNDGLSAYDLSVRLIETVTRHEHHCHWLSVVIKTKLEFKEEFVGQVDKSRHSRVELAIYVV